MKYRRSMNRRTILRGAGTIAIGLPFLDEMLVSSVWGQPAAPPHRAIDIFFGEGLPTHVQDDHLANLTGPLEPLKRHQAKLGFIRGCAFPQMGGAHEAGGMCAFVGARFVSRNQSGGPSIDQVMLRELYPQGLPASMIPTLAMGFFGSYRVAEQHFRRIRSWRDNGSPSELPKSFPSEFFTRIFGSSPDLATRPADNSAQLAAQRLARRRKSVIDSVMNQYRHLMSDAGDLSAGSRARLADHFERLREYEQRSFQIPSVEQTPAQPQVPPGCRNPGQRADPPLYKGQTSFNGVDLDCNDISAHWRLLVDLFVMAYRCDLARFGVANFLNVGDRIDVRGRYTYEGRFIYEFNDSRDRAGAGEGERVNHESFHAWDNRGNPVAPHHLHFHMREISYMLSQLDDPAFTDANGKTLLDNAMVMITTELSEPGAHKVTNMFHAVGPCGGRLKVGGHITRAGDGTRPAADIYNTVLRAYGINRTMAPGEFRGTIDAMRV